MTPQKARHRVKGNLPHSIELLRVSTLTTEYTGLDEGDKMNKFEVHISFVVAANTRREVYSIVGDISHRHLRDMATIKRVSLKPLPDPQEWIAINEPIKAQG